jgi:hypothetical protein
MSSCSLQLCVSVVQVADNAGSSSTWTSQCLQPLLAACARLAMLRGNNLEPRCLALTCSIYVLAGMYPEEDSQSSEGRWDS